MDAGMLPFIAVAWLLGPAVLGVLRTYRQGWTRGYVGIAVRGVFASLFWLYLPFYLWKLYKMPSQLEMGVAILEEAKRYSEAAD
jgi:hypothetical protein